MPLTVELKLEVWDSPNSAGVVIDAVRLIKLALNNGIAGQLDGPSSYLMKSPHTQRPDDRGAVSRPRTFIAKYARKAAGEAAAASGRDQARSKPSPSSAATRPAAGCPRVSVP